MKIGSIVFGPNSQFERTKAGTIDWKMEAERSGRLLADLERLVIEYLSECDNPVPDAGYRRTLRNRMRSMVGAPAEPPPRNK